MPATDENRQIRLTTPFGKDVALISRLSGSERLSEPFQYDVSVLSEDGALDPDKVLGHPVTVTCGLPTGGAERHFHGLVSEFTQLGYGERHHEYRLTLRPWFWFLTRTADCCVFQDLTVVEIFQKVAKDKGFSDFRTDLAATYAKRPYCVQYRETAFNFLSRLLEQEGIYYYFVHAKDKHTMVLVDDSAKHAETAGYDKVPYYPPTLSAAQRKRDHLTSWTFVRSVQPGKYATTDFDFKKSTTSLLDTNEVTRKHAQAAFEIYDYPAEATAMKDADDSALVAAESARIAKIRLQEFQACHSVAHGRGNAMGLASGSQFALENYPRADLNMKYLVVGTRCSLESNAHQTGQPDDTDFQIDVEAIDLRTQFRPARVTPKPVVQGAQTATVVGKSGEEIDTDELGRVKVQFHWDRVGRKDEKSSCRVRVAQAWAGQGWGSVQLPRIGQEVVVDFLEGDPDRPIITGRLYNGQNKPPYALPANATQSGAKSRSSKSGDDKTFNEIRFEDKKGSEHIHIHAEKDLVVDVENNATWRIGLDEDADKIGKGEAKVTVNKTAAVTIDESLDVKVTKKFVKVDAGEEITLVTGQSKIVMKKDGTITIDCKDLTVKATGSIEMKASNSITAKAQNSIKGEAMNAVELEGKAKFAAKGAQVAIEGQAQVNVKSSAIAKVEGSAMLDLSSSGITSLKGTLTKIG